MLRVSQGPVLRVFQGPVLRVPQGPVLEVSQDLVLRVSLVLCRVSLYGGSRVLITHQNLCVNMTICILYNFLPRRCGGGGGGGGEIVSGDTESHS